MPLITIAEGVLALAVVGMVLNLVAAVVCIRSDSTRVAQHLVMAVVVMAALCMLTLAALNAIEILAILRETLPVGQPQTRYVIGGAL